MYPHRIRLRGPWQYEPLTATRIDADGVHPLEGTCPAPGKLKVPTAWSETPLAGFHGRVRFRRSFHKPRTLDPDECLWLAFGGVDYFAEVFLNGERLGSHAGYFEPFAFEISSLLEMRNELLVDVDLPCEAAHDVRYLFRGLGDGADGGIWHDVVLEVRPPVRLTHVRVQPPSAESGASKTLRLSGQVLGEISTPLGLDISLNSQSLVHQRVEATPGGTPLQWSFPVEDLEAWQTWDRGSAAVHELRLDLHGAARTLDQYAVPFGITEFPEAREDHVQPHPVRAVSQHEMTWAQQAARWRSEARRFVRVPGRVLPEALYLQLDRAGIALCQDFPAGVHAADDPPSRHEAVRQARAMVRQLGHHPSIVRWCCSAGGPETINSLHEAVRQAIQEEDPSRPCVLAVPSPEA